LTASEPTTRFFEAPNPHGEPGTHRLAFYEWGDITSSPIVCVHGLTRNGRDFDYLASELSRTHRVIAIDIAGRGLSENLPKPEWYENGVYMRDVLALMERLNIQACDYVGTSMGGIIGMMIASFQPQKITRLVLNDIGAEIPKAGLLRIASYTGRAPAFQTTADAENWLRIVMQPFGVQSEEHWQHFFRHTIRQGAGGKMSLACDPAIALNLRAGLEQVKDLDALSLWPIWEHVACPTLVLRGATSDILSHETLLRMQENHSVMQFAEFSGIGHAPTLMEEEQIKTVQRFLDGIS